MEFKKGDRVKYKNGTDFGELNNLVGKVMYVDDMTGACQVKFELNSDDETYKPLIQFCEEGDIELAESLNESVKKKVKLTDVIEPFVYTTVGVEDDEVIPTWGFVNTVAAALDMEPGCVIELAKELGYKCYVIRGSVFSCKEVIAAKEIKKEDIEADYTDYVDMGRPAYIEEI